MPRVSTAASTSRPPPARPWSPRPAVRSASRGRPGRRGSPSAFVRPTAATTPPTCTCRRHPYARATRSRRASSSARWEPPAAPGRRPRRTCTSACATPGAATPTTTRSASCHRPRRSHPEAHRHPSRARSRSARRRHRRRYRFRVRGAYRFGRRPLDGCPWAHRAGCRSGSRGGCRRARPGVHRPPSHTVSPLPSRAALRRQSAAPPPPSCRVSPEKLGNTFRQALHGMSLPAIRAARRTDRVGPRFVDRLRKARGGHTSPPRPLRLDRMRHRPALTWASLPPAWVSWPLQPSSASPATDGRARGVPGNTSPAKRATASRACCNPRSAGGSGACLASRTRARRSGIPYRRGFVTKRRYVRRFVTDPPCKPLARGAAAPLPG
jgi:hypothetical protein